MWLRRRIDRMKWTKKRNKVVLKRIGDERSFIKMLKSRKKSWVWHILKGQWTMNYWEENRRKSKRKNKNGMLSGVKERKINQLMKEEAKDWMKWRRSTGYLSDRFIDERRIRLLSDRFIHKRRMNTYIVYKILKVN